MKIKFKSIIIGLLIMCTFSLFGCKKVEDEGNKIPGKVEDNVDKAKDGVKENMDEAKEKVDSVTMPSRANSMETFEYSIENSWIVIVEKDLEVDKEITLNTGFKKDSEEVSRVLVIFSKDDAGNAKDLYTLTVPKLTVLDKGAKLEGGTLKGDVYVDVNDVFLQEITIDGNVYFKDEEAKNTFIIDEHSKVTGVMEVK